MLPVLPVLPVVPDLPVVPVPVYTCGLSMNYYDLKVVIKVVIHDMSITAPKYILELFS
jgi:hypothetical protein